MALNIFVKAFFVFLVVYLIYKSGLHNKAYKLVNQFTGNTREFQRLKKKRDKVLKRIMKANKFNEEI